MYYRGVGFYLIALLAICGISCEEVVEPSLVSTDPILVIEGRVSDQPNQTFVKLTTTAPFNEPDPNPPFRSARVQIRNNAGELVAFFEQDPGIYVPSESSFVGRKGDSYSLFVRAGDFNYTALASMPPEPEIDSLTFQFEPRSLDQEAGYYVSYYYQDPNSQDFHLLEFWRNGMKSLGEKFEIRNDVNVNGKYLQFVVPQPFAAFDTVEVRINSLNQQAYRYFEGLNLLVESGSPSQAVPENPFSNIFSEQTTALGVFYATSTVADSIIIQP